MSAKPPRRQPPRPLAEAAAAYQVAAVIPHCTQCSNPCCRLDPLVLELNWKQLKTLWLIDESRTAFDRRLATGQGPVEIRAGNGLYYAHGKVCPAFDEACGTCRVYDQETKPPGCSDFPVYEDEGCIIADLRCEAVDLEALAASMLRALGPGFRIVKSADADFPFLVTLSVKRVAGPAGVSKRPRNKK